MIVDKLVKVASNMSLDAETFVALGALLALVAPKVPPTFAPWSGVHRLEK